MGRKLSLDETADELGLSIRTVRRLISQGELRAYKIGKKTVRVDVEDVAKVLQPIMPNGKP